MNRRIKVIFPVPGDERVVQMFAAQLPSELIRPGFEVQFVGSKQSYTLAESYYDMAIMEMAVLEAGLLAEAEGYAAVCINTMSDSAFYALRSRLSIPVLTPAQTSFHVACMLGHKFSIVTMWDEWFPLYRKTLTEYGLWPRLASMRSIGVRPDAQELLTGKEDVVFDRLEAESRKAIDEDGADVIILGSTTMHQSHQHLTRCLPVPVINPGVIAYKLCEVFLELGLTHSKHAFPAPQSLKDEALIRALDPGHRS